MTPKNLTSVTADALPAPLACPGELRSCDSGLTRAFGLLGKRWNGVILGSLSHGPAGFAELRRGVGAITDSVLSDRLTELVAAGLVLRSVSDGRPPGVTYELTAAGSALLPILDQLAGWATANLPDGAPIREDLPRQAR